MGTSREGHYLLGFGCTMEHTSFWVHLTTHLSFGLDVWWVAVPRTAICGFCTRFHKHVVTEKKTLAWRLGGQAEGLTDGLSFSDGQAGSNLCQRQTIWTACWTAFGLQAGRLPPPSSLRTHSSLCTLFTALLFASSLCTCTHSFAITSFSLSQEQQDLIWFIRDPPPLILQGCGAFTHCVYPSHTRAPTLCPTPGTALLSSVACAMVGQATGFCAHLPWDLDHQQQHLFSGCRLHALFAPPHSPRTHRQTSYHGTGFVYSGVCYLFPFVGTTLLLPTLLFNIVVDHPSFSKSKVRACTGGDSVG